MPLYGWALPHVSRTAVLKAGYGTAILEHSDSHTPCSTSYSSPDLLTGKIKSFASSCFPLYFYDLLNAGIVKPLKEVGNSN